MAKHRIFISAGEISGDSLGADLMRELNSITDIEFYGLGGKNMFNAGLNSITEDVSTLSTVGFIESLRFYKKKANLIKQSSKFIKDNGIRTVIAVDNQGFSIPLLRKAKKLGAKTFFYIPPRVSIWGEWNAPKIPQIADYLITFFDEDREIYSRYTENVTHTGNPIIDRIESFNPDPDFYIKNRLDKSLPIVSIFPGSRFQEIETLIDTMLQAGRILSDEHNFQIVLPVSHSIFDKTVRDAVSKAGLADKVRIIDGQGYQAMYHSVANIMASGTATLESALFKKPTVICYKVSGLTFFIGKRLVPKQMIGLPNILSDKKIFPELLQKDFNPREIVKHTLALIETNDTYTEYYDKIRAKLGNPPVVKKAARYIAERLEE
jgi:lipid-A-disaccharide synthase